MIPLNGQVYNLGIDNHMHMRRRNKKKQKIPIFMTCQHERLKVDVYILFDWTDVNITNNKKNILALINYLSEIGIQHSKNET